MLDSDTPKARKILKECGATFDRKTKDEVHGDSFINEIFYIYGYSNSKGGMMCSWTTDEDLEYKEF